MDNGYGLDPVYEIYSHLVFFLGTTPICIIICHDIRFPELCRIPVLAGARIIFYLSCEQWHDDLPITAHHKEWNEKRIQQELGVYRAQTQARAVENCVWLVKANAAALKCDDDSGDPHPEAGSHGCSCIIDPTGCVQIEASVFDETIVKHRINLNEASAQYAEKSLISKYALCSLWSTNLPELVKIHKTTK